MEPAAESPATLAGGRYLLERLVGEPPDGRSYVGRDTRLGRRVAIALVRSDAPRAARLRRQAEALARVDHPNILAVYDIGEEAGYVYTVRQHVAGGTLADALAAAPDGRLAAEQALRIGQDLCRALERAHSDGLVHGEITPRRVLLTAAGGAKLADFAPVGEAPADDEHAYAAPEVAAGRPADMRSDLYSLGVLLCEIVCGARPASAADAAELLATCHDGPAPEHLAPVLGTLLEDDPARRPASATVVREALAAYAGDELVPVAEAEVRSPATPPAVAQPRALDRLRAAFVGRDAESSLLADALQEADAGAARIVLVAGEPGIGKTRLTEMLGARAREQGAAVLWGRCYEGEGAPAYWPWVQVIRSHLRATGARDLHELGAGAADLARLVPDVEAALPAAPEPESADPEQRRFRLYAAVATLLRAAARAQPVVVILEDLHWADTSSLQLLQFVVRERPERVLVVATLRDEELEDGHPFRAVLERISRRDECRRVALRGLGEDAVRDLLASATQHELDPAGETLAATLHRETEGNPFFIAEILRHLVETGAVELRDGTWRVSDDSRAAPAAIPEGIREAIRRRLARLGDECRRVLTIAAVIGREFSPDLLARVARVERDVLGAALREAAAAHVVEQADGRSRFAHALIRETLYADLSGTARVYLHRDVGRTLEALHADDLGPHLAELAYHFREAALAGEAERAIGYAARAGDRAVALLAHEEAAGHYARALEALALKRPVDRRRECELRIALGEAQAKSGDTARARATFEAAAALARGLGCGELLGRAALGIGMGLGGFAYTDSADDVLIGLLEEALNVIPEGDCPMRVRLLARLAVELYYTSAAARREALSAQALAMARRLGDPAAELVAHHSRHWSVWGPDEIDERLKAATELLALADRVGDREMAFRGHHFRLATLLELGDLEAADAELRACIAIAGELRQPVYFWQAGCLRAMRALLDGRLHEGERLALEAQKIGRRGHAAISGVLFGTQLLFLRWAQRRLEEIVDPIRELAERYPRSSWRPSITMVYAETGRRREAAAELDAMSADGFRYLRRDGNWLASISVVCLAAEALRDEARCAALYELIAPYEDRLVLVGAGSICLGPVTLYRGLLARVLGRRDDARRHFEALLATSRRIGARPFITWAELELAGLAGESAGLAAARADAAAIGFECLVARAAAHADAMR